MPKGILNKASLVMVPEAPIDGTMPSVFPEDRSGDFTFTRGSNLAATRVASNGLIEKGRENLLVQSNQFDTIWGKIVTTEFGGQSGYDGTNDAWRINLNAGTTLKAVTQNFSAYSGVSTASFYAKAGTHSIVQFGTASQSDVFVAFDLSNGSVGPLSAYAIDASATSVGGGWYRIQVAFQAAGAAGFVIAAVDSLSATRFPSTSSTGDFYIQDAQLEVGLVATDYIESGATTGKAGLLENEPRIDFTGGGCGALLLEPSRTNLFTQSEYFNSTDWVKTNVTATDNSNVSPEGLQNATLINEGTAAATQHWFYQPISLSSGNTYTISFYAKYVDRKNMFINIYDGITSNFVFYDIQNGVVLNNDGNAVRDIVDVGNGWYRIIYTRAVVGSGANFRIGMANDTPIQTYTGENKQALVYGLQLEAGSYATSYIPTYGSSVTRSVDDCKVEDLQSNGIVGSTWTYVFEWGNYVAARNFEMKDSSSFNFLFMVSRLIRYTKQDGSVGTLFSLPTNGTSLKALISYDGTTLKSYMNGSLINSVTDAKTNNFSDFDFLRLDRSFDDSEEFKQLLLFPTALTDEECSALTQP